jgi:hypothetical protein
MEGLWCALAVSGGSGGIAPGSTDDSNAEQQYRCKSIQVENVEHCQVGLRMISTACRICD